MSKHIEPFIYKIRVGWADCDPAFIAYTAKIPGFALEAIDAWWERKIGYGWFQLNIDKNVGTPFVHMSLDFRSPITPRHELVCEVSLLKLGNSSLHFSVKGRQDGVLCFEGEFVSVLVIAKTMKAQRPPAEILDKIKSFALESE